MQQFKLQKKLISVNLPHSVEDRLVGTAKVKWPMQTWSHFSIMGIVHACKVNVNVCIGLEVCIYLLCFVFIYFRCFDYFFVQLIFPWSSFWKQNLWSGVLQLRYWHTDGSTWRDHFCLRTKLSRTGSLLQHSILQRVHFGLKGRFLSILKVDLIHHFTWLTWANIQI